eukprot:EG_transcript_17113
MADELYDIRNSMVLGNFAQAISDGSSIKSNPYKKPAENDAMLAERDALVFKAHIGMGQYDIVIDDLANASAPLSKAIRLLAQYLKADAQSNEAAKAQAVANAKDLAKSAESSLAPAQFLHVAATVAAVLIHDGELEPALKLIRGAQGATGGAASPALLELHGLAVDILLRIHRADQAEKEQKTMSSMDDDATVTQLSAAWVCLAQGGDRVTEALQIFEELKEKFGASVLLLNGMALAHMSKGHFDTAEKLLLDAMSKRSADPETLINLITCSQQLKKGLELITRYVTQLRNSYPHHPWVRSYLAMESKFDKAARQAA